MIIIEVLYFYIVYSIYASYRGGVTYRVSGLRRVRGGFLGRVNILKFNPPQTHPASGLGRLNPGTRQAIILGSVYSIPN